MTVLVTGAAGFLGSHVTRLLTARGTRPRTLIGPGDDARWLEEAGAEVCRGDVCDRSVVEPALLGADCVIHCAARTGPWGPAGEYERTNVRGLEMLVRAAMAAGVRRVVHVSSITVHGNNVRGQADEDAPLRREANPYSRSKVAGEQLLRRLIRDEGARVTIVRPGWIYGPGDAASFARVAAMIERGRMLLVGSGRNHLPLIYVSDAAHGIVQAAEAGPAEGRCYLLVNDEPATQRDFVAAIAAELGVPAPTRRIPYRLAMMLGAASESLGRLARSEKPPPVTRYGLQLLGGENRFVVSRARRELGFSPATGLADGVARSVGWYRRQRRASDTAKAPA